MMEEALNKLAEQLENIKKDISVWEDDLYNLKNELSSEGVSKTENTTWPIQGDDYFWISCEGEVDSDIWANSRTDREMRAIGNCFRTEAEAEKAIKKLKAFKHLRDKGFKFGEWDIVGLEENKFYIQIEAEISAPLNTNYLDTNDLDLLFGGEE